MDPLDKIGPNSSAEGRASTFRSILLYGLTVVAAIVAFLAIRGYGQMLAAPSAKVTQSESETIDVSQRTREPAPQLPQKDVFLHVLLTWAAVVLLGRLFATVFAYLSQPPVIGEVLAGIALGPSILGSEFAGWLLPPQAVGSLSTIAQIGVILYMFLVGLDLNAELLRDRARVTVAISHASIVVPFILGSALALFFYPRLSTSDVSFTSFALFFGIAMSVTAFPVLARILTDRGISQTPLGIIALSCAAADDLTAWCLLALVTGVARSQVGSGLWVAVGAAAYITIMLVVIRPCAKWLVARCDTEAEARRLTSVIFVALLFSSLATEWIGIHAIFGAFLLGAMIPRESAVARGLVQHLSSVVTVLFLPTFFALSGMRTRIDLLSRLDHWLLCAAIISVATAGKFGGSMVAGRLTGLTWRDATALGTLMNTRGLMELIVLGVGLDLRVISPTVFSMMIIMALVTTMTTAPVLRLLTRESPGSG